MAEELDKKLYKQITDLCDLGNEQTESEQYEKAFDYYLEALKLVPEPIEKWETSTWIFASLGDCKFLLNEFEAAHYYLTSAMYCPGGIGNEFIHLRLGQTQYELGNMDRALDELTRAYMSGGEELFEGEDPKYFNFIRSKLKGV
ncbi:MAG TPA: hypothetical protein VFG10_05765 [Saprospiraceae bacterium]|nr:hypothetical protein [Saprospiraceae bacterium]